MSWDVNKPKFCLTDSVTDDETLCTLLQAPADTALLSQKHLFTTVNPIETTSDDFLSLTYQTPKLSESAPGDNLCNIEEILVLTGYLWGNVLMIVLM
mgnify:FL=1